jgi:hypothetical protein
MAELVSCVAAALGEGVACTAVDTNHDGRAEISEIVAAVNAALNGCPATPTPTATVPATLDSIQTGIFSPRCALPGCHDAATHVENLDLSAGSARGQLVGVAPATDVASAKGLLRVDAGNPDNSFLLIKVEGPQLLTADERLPIQEPGPTPSAAATEISRH